jgi:hypothetical protein
MNRTPVFEDHLGDWLKDGPTDAPDRVLDNILAAFPSIPQRRVAPRLPWGLPRVNSAARALAGIAAIAVVAAGGLLLSNGLPSNQVGAAPSVSPSASPSGSLIDTSGWTSFTSARHGISVRYPANWTVTPATAPWPAATDFADPPHPMLDTFTSPTKNVTIAVVSQPLPTGMTGEAWLASRQAANVAQDPANAVCWPAPSDMERGTVDGLPAWIHSGCDSSDGSNNAVVFAGGRVYEITQYLDPTFNRPLFDAFLSTITFDPTNADDTPVASPGPSAR